MYWNETAWMAIKQPHIRYPTDDGKTRHTKTLYLHQQKPPQGVANTFEYNK
jgi:hypothetical protein